MSRVQSRRTVSFNRDLYERMIDEAHRADKSVAHWITDLARAEMKRVGRPLRGHLTHEPPRIVARMTKKRWIPSRARKADERRRLVDNFMKGVLP